MKLWPGLYLLLALTLLCPALAAQGIVGLPFHLTLTRGGDQLFESYVFRGGNLPPGLSFFNSGLQWIAGVPTQSGAFTFTVASCNIFGTGCGPSDQWPSRAITINIHQPCATLSKTSDVFDFASSTRTVAVIAPDNCDWLNSAGSEPLPELPFWLHLTYPTQRGSATVTYSVDATTYGRSATIVLGDTLFTVSQRRTAQVFQDVLPPADSFDAVDLMAQRQITVGCSAMPALYCPEAETSRAQMAAFLVRAVSGESFASPAEPYFSDVPAAHPFFKYIQKLRELNITNGCGAGRYCPDRAASRAEVIALLMRAALGPATVFPYAQGPWFPDVPASHPFFPYIQKAVETGITRGCGNGLFCPDAPTPREDAALLLMRALFGEKLP